MAMLTSSHTDLQPKMSGFLAHVCHQDRLWSVKKSQKVQLWSATFWGMVYS